MRKGSGYSEVRAKDWKLAAFVAACLIVVAFIVGRITAPEASGPAVPRPQPDVSSQQNEAGAVEAATQFARAMAGPSGDDATYLNDMRTMAAPTWRERASELGASAIEFVTERYGRGGAIEFEPIRYRLRSHSQEEATVDIWGVVLATGPKVNGIEESWITGTIKLVWVENQWKVAGQSSEGGPTPEQLRTEEGSTTVDILSEFSKYGSAQDL